MSDFNNINSSLSIRRMPYAGRNSSEDINDSFEEILHDLGELYLFVNTTIIPIINGLGKPGTYSDVNPVANGLDGTTLITDRVFTDSNNPYFYNSNKSRPNTVKETSLKLVEDINSLFATVNQINQRIGQVSTSQTANPATLSEIENRLNYFIGIVRSLQNNSSGFLTASGIATALADGTINPSSFNIVDDDVSAIAAILPTKLSGVDLTQTLDYTLGVPANYDMQDSVLRIKEWVEDLSGETFSSFSNSGLSGDSLKTHRESLGTGTPASTNPHGLDVSDLSDTNDLLSQPVEIAHFNFNIDSVSFDGGYHYINSSYTVTQIAGTVINGGTTGVTATIMRRRSGSNATIYGNIAIPATSPGQVSVTSSFTNTDLQAGDTLFVSGISGDGVGARIFVWGQRT